MKTVTIHLLLLGATLISSLISQWLSVVGTRVAMPLSNTSNSLMTFARNLDHKGTLTLHAGPNKLILSLRRYMDELLAFILCPLL